METIQVTVGILSFQSAATIARAIGSVACCADILVCDGGSTDGTRDIAKQLGARVIDQPQQGAIEDFSSVRNHMLSSAVHEWFLQIDADETASKELLEEVRTIVQGTTSSLIYRVPQGLNVQGREVLYYSSLPGYQHRFFAKQSGARYTKPIHERIAFSAQSIGTLKGKWFVHWDEREIRAGSTTEHVRRDAQFTVEQPFFQFLYHKIIRNLLGIAHILIYVLWARFFHRWSRCAPLSAEWRKIVYKVRHIWYALEYRYSS